jgi:hypothetical protein
MNGKECNYLWSLVLLIYCIVKVLSRCRTYEWQGMELPANTSVVDILYSEGVE